MSASMRLIGYLVATLALVTPSAAAGDLTFEERVKAQEAIERVYYSHQIGASRPFEERIPRPVLERKVREYLRQSAALDKYWNTPVTAEMLERETERMLSGSTSFSRRSETVSSYESAWRARYWSIGCHAISFSATSDSTRRAGTCGGRAFKRRWTGFPFA
jgi:hypothetical protein